MLAPLALPILLALIAGVVAAFVPQRWSVRLGVITALIATLIYALLATTITESASLKASFWSVPSLGVTGGLSLDGLSALFVLLISGIGTLIFLYTGRYLHNDPRQRRLVVMLLLFMGAMLGAVSADDVIILFIFWELTSLTSFFLIGYDHENASSRYAALQSLLVTAGGGLALLAGLIMIATAAGTTSLSGILAAPARVLAQPSSLAAMALIVLGCFTKSAQFPFHFWLPNAMAAPTPVSAYLHSATMVKLGVYLLARLAPLYSGNPAWQFTLSLFGATTAVTGIVLAFRTTDLKRILAYTTVSALGLLTLLLGIGTKTAIIAAFAFLIVHALYKACLFLVAGIIDHATGVRDITALRGLGRAMPMTAGVAALAALSMAGVPPLLGFVAKELVYEAVLSAGAFAYALSTATFIVNAGTVAIAALLSVHIFTGDQRNTPRPPHEPGWAMLTGPVLLASLGLLCGLLLTVAVSNWILSPSAATLGYPSAQTLSLWHGITPILGLSGLTIATGILLYRLWPRIYGLLSNVQLIDQWAPVRGYDALLSGTLKLAHHTTLLVQSGSLRVYMRILFIVAAGVVLATLLGRNALRWPGFSLDLLDLRYLAFGALIIGALAAARAKTAFAAVIATGLTGFAAALTFLFFGAPDVSFTQFSVETLLVVIIASTLARVPIPTRDTRTNRQKRVDALIGIGMGAGLTLTLLSVLAAPLDLRLSEWFGQHSYVAAHGRNVVNVILVDFRALDTLGETTVLAIAAFAVHSLLRAAMRARQRSRQVPTKTSPSAQRGHSV